jgi:hypothetical protein
MITVDNNSGTYTLPANDNTVLTTNSWSWCNNNNNNNNQMKQTKVAIFKIKRNKNKQVVSSTFIKEMWIEQSPNISLDLVVAKSLDPDFNPEEIVIKELQTIYL